MNNKDVNGEAKCFGRSLKCIDVFLVIYVGSNVEKLPDESSSTRSKSSEV